MNYSTKHRKQSLTFKQWSGKNYAIFASLGKEVKIGHVCNDITEKAVLKGQSAILNYFINDITCLNDITDEDVDIDNINLEQLVSLLSVINFADISSGQLPLLQNQILNNEQVYCISGMSLCVFYRTKCLFIALYLIL